MLLRTVGVDVEAAFVSLGVTWLPVPAFFVFAPVAGFVMGLQSTAAGAQRCNSRRRRGDEFVGHVLVEDGAEIVCGLTGPTRLTPARRQHAQCAESDRRG